MSDAGISITVIIGQPGLSPLGDRWYSVRPDPSRPLTQAEADAITDSAPYLDRAARILRQEAYLLPKEDA